MLALSALLYAVHWFVYYSIKISLPAADHLHFWLDCAHYALWVLLPVTGWVAESWLGRYRAIFVGLLLSTVTVLILQVVFVLLNIDMDQIPAFVLAIGSLVFGIFGIGGIYTIMLPFTLDQMIGASAEELSATVHWYFWGFNISLLTREILPYVLTQLHYNTVTTSVVFLTLGSSSLSAVLVMDCLCHKWLDTDDKTGNPIKLIYEVLNYARKNKYPRLRSAFTYIDEEQPLRLDFGKRKFGGPFTEEEVEDVRTLFRLIPLLVFTIIGPFLTLEFYDQLGLHAISVTTNQTLEFVSNLKSTTYYTASLFLIPVYRFILYPLIGKYIPSMLEMIGAGISLCLLSVLINLAVESVLGHFYSNASHCTFHDMATTGTIPIPLYWVLIIELVNGVGAAMTVCSLFEFVMAQTPNRMRGVMMGLVITVIGFGVLGTVIHSQIFKISQLQTATPSCVFYYYLVLSLLMLLILVVYVVLAKHYKLRERERHLNVNVVVEEHYTRYLDKEEEYMNDISSL